MKIKKILVPIAAAMALSLPIAVLAQTEEPQIDDETAATSESVQGDDQAPMADVQTTSENIEADRNESAGMVQAAADDEELPKTASPFALLALLGLLSAGFAIGVRYARQS